MAYQQFYTFSLVFIVFAITVALGFMYLIWQSIAANKREQTRAEFISCGFIGVPLKKRNYFNKMTLTLFSRFSEDSVEVSLKDLCVALNIKPIALKHIFLAESIAAREEPLKYKHLGAFFGEGAKPKLQDLANLIRRTLVLTNIETGVDTSWCNDCQIEPQTG